MFTPTMDEQIGKKLNRRRKLLGLTQADLARALSVGFQQIHKYECGINKISAATLWKMAEALEVHPDYFFGGTAPDEGDRASEPELDALVGSVQVLPPTVQRGLLELVRSMAEDSAKQFRTTRARHQPNPSSPSRDLAIA